MWPLWRRGEPEGEGWPDGMRWELWHSGAVFYAVVPLVFECGKYILTLFFFFLHPVPEEMVKFILVKLQEENSVLSQSQRKREISSQLL